MTGEKVADDSLGTAKLSSLIPAARVTQSGAILVSDAFPNDLGFNQERYDTASLHSNANPTRLIAPVDGVYAVSTSVSWTADTSGYRRLILRRNGTADVASDTRNPVADDTGQTLSTLTSLKAGDYLEVSAFQTSGGSLSITKSNELSPEFAMTWVAPGL